MVTRRSRGALVLAVLVVTVGCLWLASEVWVAPVEAWVLDGESHGNRTEVSRGSRAGVVAGHTDACSISDSDDRHEVVIDGAGRLSQDWWFTSDGGVMRAHCLKSVRHWLDPRWSSVRAGGPTAATALAAGRCSSMFEQVFVDEITTTYPGTRFTAAVHDHRTGCSYSLNPDLALTTASVIKAQVLAGVLLAAQEEGRRLTTSEAADIVLMMHYSHNTPPTSRLYVDLGGAPAMEALDERFGIVGTSHTARYGATVSTAEDRTVLIEQLLIGGGPLDVGSVRMAWSVMSKVSDIQSWGLTAGLPAGYQAALKNGFYPSRGVGWRLGTTGVVRDPDGGAYAVTVMTDQNRDEFAGIALVEAITRHINAALAAGSPASRPVDEVACIRSRPGWSWPSAAAALGEVDSQLLRRLNGGEAAPLAGQRICRP